MATSAIGNPARAPREFASEPPRPSRLWAVLVLGAAIIPYLSSLRFSFVYDDNVQVLAIPAIRSWSFVPAYFFKPIPGVVVRYYRPIFFLWFRLNYFLWNTNAWGWHLTNVALHATASVLAFLLLSMHFKDRRCAAAGALMFAVHPAHIETVAWISGCTDSLMAIGLVGSLLLWMKNRGTPRLTYGMGSLLCCLAALLSKETAIILPVLIAIYAFVGIPTASQVQHAPDNRLRHALREAAPYAGLTALYLVARSWVLSGIAGTPNWVSHTQSLLTLPSLLLFYVRHMFWPTGLSIFYDFPVVDRAGSYQFWLPLVALAAIVGGMCLWFRRSRDARVFVAGAWILLPVAPVLYIRMFQPDEFVHDRYLYLPVLGLSILAGVLCEFLWKEGSGKQASAFPAAIIGVMVLFLAVATTAQAEPWKNNLSLYARAIQVAPKNTMARNNLATEYATEGRYQEASEILKALLQDRPDMWLANYNYGYINYRLGNLPVAEQYLNRATRIDGSDADQFVYLGTTYFKEGRLTEAAQQLRHGIALRPDGNGYHFTLGMIELQRGNIASAREEMQKELKYHPESRSRVAQAQSMFEQLTKSAP